jgi:hypothetical protein
MDRVYRLRRETVLTIDESRRPSEELRIAALNDRYIHIRDAISPLISLNEPSDESKNNS